MSDIYEVVWPSGVPSDLWNFFALQGSKKVLPFMDITIEKDFVISTFVGVAILVVFGWKRFNVAANPDEETKNRVLEQVSPLRMRGQSAMTWAYAAYLFLIIAIYVLLTFFGELVFTLSKALPIAGIQVNADTLNLGTPAWPLALSLGFVGLAPLLPPIAAAETWLRATVHSGFGIPARLKDHAEKLVIGVAEAVAGRKVVPIKVKHQNLPAWLQDHLRSHLDWQRAFRLEAELKIFLHWNSEPLGWPKQSERADIAVLQAQIIKETRACLEDFEDITSLNIEPFQKNGGGKGNADLKDKTAQQRRNLEQRFDQVLGKMYILRNELATIIALFSERSPDFQSISHETLDGELKLSQMLDRYFPENYAMSPIQGLLWMCLPISLFFLIGAQYRVISLLASVPLVPTTVMTSAALYLCSFLATFVIPAVVVFYWRYRMIDTQRWVSRSTKSKAIWGSALAFCVSFLANISLSIFWIALVSENGEQLRNRLFDLPHPDALIHASKAIVSAYAIGCSIIAEEYRWNSAYQIRTKKRKLEILQMIGGEDRENIDNLKFEIQKLQAKASNIGKKRVFLGFLSAAGVFVLVLSIFYSWYGGYGIEEYCVNSLLSMRDLYSETLCRIEIIGPELVVFPVAAFFICTPIVYFGYMHSRQQAGIAGKGLLIALAFCGFAIADTARAEDSVAPGELERIVVGFRADAEPFVYKIYIDGEGMYTGYLADLCFAIFENSRYDVLPIAITADNRFRELLKPSSSEEGERVLPSAEDWMKIKDEESTLSDYKVDVLCDPITLRYEEEGGDRTAGIFSPIIYATGVSYMEANKSQSGREDPYGGSHEYGDRSKPVLIGFAENSTARDVAIELCEVDQFGIRARAEARLDFGGDKREAERKAKKLQDGGQHDVCVSSLNLLEGEGDVSESKCDLSNLGYAATDAPESMYRYCVFKSHRELIKWFCDGEASSYHRVYLGDRDLISGKLATWRDKHGNCGSSKIVESPTYFTYEPYALLTTAARPELVRHVQRRVYQFFSDRDGALGKFVEYFPGQRMSPALAYLHLINAVSRPENFKHAD